MLLLINTFLFKRKINIEIQLKNNYNIIIILSCNTNLCRAEYRILQYKTLNNITDGCYIINVLFFFSSSVFWLWVGRGFPWFYVKSKNSPLTLDHFFHCRELKNMWNIIYTSTLRPRSPCFNFTFCVTFYNRFERP